MLNSIEVLHKLLNNQEVFNYELDNNNMNNNSSKAASSGNEKPINQVALLSELMNGNL